jgi:hypothetical protein
MAGMEITYTTGLGMSTENEQLSLYVQLVIFY